MKFIDTFKDRKFKLSHNQKLYSPLPLGKFFQLDELKRVFHRAIREKNKFVFKKAMLDIISLQTGEEEKPDNFLHALVSVIEIINNNALDAEAVFLRPPPKTGEQSKQERPRWDYDGRAFATWIDAFARNYGCDLQTILELDVNTAAFLYQEILVTEQLEKEWNYSLTEMAYPTDSSGKANYRPLSRPYWMNDIDDKPLPVARIPKHMLPSGVVIDLSGMGLMKNDESNSEDISTKETN